MTPVIPAGEVRPLGDRALLVGADDARSARALARAIQTALATRGPDPVTADAAATSALEHQRGVEVVCGEATVMVTLSSVVEPGPRRAVVEAVQAALSSEGAAGEESGRLVTAACRFDGPDLDEVAALVGSTPEEVVALLTREVLSVAFVGFSPGFAYLDGLPAPLAALPRRPRPRPVVPIGSVALANGRAAVYPTASPGGWHLVGRTGVHLFSTEDPPYALLAPGDRVCFRVAGSGEAVHPSEPVPVEWCPPPHARPVLEVVVAGMRTAVQDGGRRDVASVGIPAAGPADPVSFHLANLLLHNAPDAGTIEITGGGARLRAVAPVHVAVVGADAELRVQGTVVPNGHVVPLERGHHLEIGRLRSGWRTYVAVAGGVIGPSVFGSGASDELARLGAGPLAAGDRLFAGPWAAPLGGHLAPGAATEIALDGEPVELRVVAGPHPELFTTDALERLAGVVYRVEPDSNRVGTRLQVEGPRPELHAGGAAVGALDSHGVVTGTVQVPPEGDPVVLGPDHATLGGYPVIAVVVEADLGRLGQCSPGTRVRLVPVEGEIAARAARAARRALEGAVVGRYPIVVG